MNLHDTCLNVKEFLARNRRYILSLSGCNENRIHNHIVRKRTLNHLAKLASLAKWLSFRLRAKWLWVRVPLQSLKLQISRLFRVRSFLTFQATIVCGFTLKLVRDMIKTCNQCYFIVLLQVNEYTLTVNLFY